MITSSFAVMVINAGTTYVYIYCSPGRRSFPNLGTYKEKIASNMALKENKNEFEAGPWRVTVTKSHILHSKCEKGLDEGCPKDDRHKCNVCR